MRGPARASVERAVLDRAVAREQRRAAADLRSALAEVRPDVLLSDVFDTLLLRTCHPEDVKRRAADRLAARLGLRRSGAAVYDLRAQLELRAYARAAEQGHDEEFRLRDVAQDLCDALADEPGLQAAGEDPVELVVALELEVEREVQRLDHAVSEVLLEHVQGGGRLVLVSDFYLSGDDLTALVTAAGWPDRAHERLVVSADHLRTKRSGRLYDLVLEDLGISPDRVLMVGDNEHSDGASARSRGLRAVVLERRAQRRLYTHLSRSSAETGALGRLRDTARAAGEDPFPELGLTVAWTVWELRSALRGSGVRSAHFLAREGAVLRELLRHLETAVGEPRTPSAYTAVSRRSTFLPSLGPLDEEAFDTLFRQYRALSPVEWLLNLGLDREEARELARSAGVDPDVVQADLPTSEALARLRDSVAFRELYEQRRTEQRTLLAEHLEASLPGSTTDHLAVVDVGWKGTIQDHLRRALAPARGVDGFYVGLVAPGALSDDNRKAGVLFDYRNAQGRYYHVFDENRALFEMALSSPHGSTARYERAPDGRAVPVLEAMTPGEEQVAELLAPLRRGLAERAASALDVLARERLEPGAVRRVVAAAHARMVLFPRPQEVALFSRLTHEENFGLFRATSFVPGRPTGLRRLSATAGAVRRPRSLVRESFWPRHTLDEMGLAPLGRAYGLVQRRRYFGGLA